MIAKLPDGGIELHLI